MKQLLCLVLSVLASPLFAQGIDASGAWARATVQGQHGTGAFMTLMARDGARLIGAASPVAGVVELHEMAMEGNVMKMREVASVDLPPGRRVQLAPGGYHVMLMDLQRPLLVGETIRIELQIETSDKRLVTLPVEAEVRRTAPDPAAQRGAQKR